MKSLHPMSDRGKCLQVVSVTTLYMLVVGIVNAVRRALLVFKWKMKMKLLYLDIFILFIRRDEAINLWQLSSRHAMSLWVIFVSSEQQPGGSAEWLFVQITARKQTHCPHLNFIPTLLTSVKRENRGQTWHFRCPGLNK